MKFVVCSEDVARRGMYGFRGGMQEQGDFVYMRVGEGDYGVLATSIKRLHGATTNDATTQRQIWKLRQQRL